MENKVKEIIAEILKKTPEEVMAMENKNNGRYWDSLQMIEILFCLEQEFSISIPVESIPKMTSIKSIVEIIKKNK